MAKAASKSVNKSKMSEDKNSAVWMRLHKWNVWLAGVYALQGIFVLLLSAGKLFPVGTSYLTQDPIASELTGQTVMTTASRHLFDINLACVAGAIFLVAALAHAAIATLYRGQYEADLKKGVQRLRWAEYGLGSGLLFVALGLLVGARELSVLVILFVLAATANLLRLAIELWQSRSKEANYILSALAVLADFGAWAGIAVYLWASGVFGSNGLPAFVYFLLGSSFLFTIGCTVRMFLSLRRTGKLADPVFAEQLYMLSGLVTKTVLVWQIFAGALQV